ncbi:hypothetical protein FE410_05315 [Leuconostoc carnosum]|uniref:hypothetical protein n=1 Tax=Leuconostoc TaxID=1243 RepID=UPI001239AE87|nr:hypothetical protein [Leuconostoc carnosum]KAA8371110.1 hypothetical protein FE414_05310 [Leuconostoc carnosum]KAA8382751.1 hypothetical protein FE410_05315 [Leuconostoc carnosum]
MATKKYDVLQAFTDKETGRLYEKGDVFKKVGVRSERIEELMSNVHPNHNGPLIALSGVSDQQNEEVDESDETILEEAVEETKE